ncbi:MAG: tetratricopeptide repeat protein [Saprospiraceae bacterium]
MKNLRLFVWWVLLHSTYPTFSQITALSAVDSQALAALPNDTVRVDALIDWAYDPQKRDRETLYAQLALAKASQIGYAEGRGYSYVKLGHIEADAGRYQEANGLYRKALLIRDSLHLARDVASCYNNLGLLQKKQSRYDSAAILFEQGLIVIKGGKTLQIAGTLHSNLGTALRYQGKYEQAIFHFKQAMSIGRQLNKPFDVASARLNLSALLQDNFDSYAEAKDSLELCLAEFANNPEFKAKCHIILGNNAYFTGNYEKALDQLEQARNLADYLSSDERAILTKNRGRIYLQQQYYDKAMEDFRTSLDTFKILGNNRETSATLFEIGNVHYEQNKIIQAVEFYQNALTYEPGDPVLKSQILFFLPDALDQLGRIGEANVYRNEYKRFMGNLDSAQTHEAWKNLMFYRMARESVAKCLLLEEMKSSQLRNFIFLGVLGLLLILTGVAFYFQRQKRFLAEQNAKIAHQQQQIAIQKNLDLLKNKELENNYARLAGQDEMQRKIGQELHDGVGAMLASVKLNLSPVDEVLDQLSENNRRQYATANRLLDEASEELRRISHELSSAVLQKFGLKAQLEALADIIPGSGKLQVELATHGLKDRLDYKTELHIYRMVQELVHNVVKHAQAQNITIQVNRFEHTINVIVEDDGRGFNLEKIRESPGIGMQNLSARVHELNGEMQLDSRPGRGTMVSIDIPLRMGHG